MKLVLTFLIFLIHFSQFRLLKIQKKSVFTSKDKENLVDEILNEQMGTLPLPRKLAVSLGIRKLPIMLAKKPRKNVMASYKNPRLDSYHPVTLAFIGKYQMDVKNAN